MSRWVFRYVGNKTFDFSSKNRIFCHKTTQFGPKLAFLVNLGQACRHIQCPVGGSVGGCGARAVSRKTPIYFIYTHYQLEGNFLILQVPSWWYHPWRRLTNSVSSPKDILKINSEKFPRYLLLWSGGPWSRGWKCASLWQGCSRGTCPWSGGFANTFIDICYFLGNL